MSDSPPMWPLALPTAAVAGLIALAALDTTPSWLYHLAVDVTGEPLFPPHAVVLSVALFLTARGLLLRRRAAWYAALAVVTLGVLAALTGADPRWRAPLLMVTAFALWRCRDALLVRPHPVRVRTAVRAFAGIVIASILAILLLGGASVHSVGPDVVNGLGAGGLDLNGPAWLPGALGLLGGIGLLAIMQILLAPAPPPPPGSALERDQVSELVAHPGSDTLAPFALRRDKSYVFSPDQRAAIGYRVLFGVAAAGGDPVGDPGSSATFSLAGRQMRNVRQAVKRSSNAGVTTSILLERSISPQLRTELLAVAHEALDGSAERGFSMNLDGLLTGGHPGSVIAIAYDREGAPLAFQRYLTAGGGLSLDAMRKLPSAPNGVNEHLITEIISYARDLPVPVVSLNFAAFRELLDATSRSPMEQLGYRAIHLLDPLIAVESLYLFDKKFRPFYKPRSVIFRSWADIGWVAAALLTLEFGRSHSAAVQPDAEPVPELSPEHR